MQICSVSTAKEFYGIGPCPKGNTKAKQKSGGSREHKKEGKIVRTVDLIIKVACVVKKVNNVCNIKSS